MKIAIIAAILVALSFWAACCDPPRGYSSILTPVAHADCLTNTILVGGRMIICTTCCMGGFCNTTCN